MDREALMAMLHKRFRSVKSTYDSVKNVTQLEIISNGHVSIDVTVESLQKLDGPGPEQVLEGLEKVLARHP
jgi:hypothetical protein